MTGARLAGGGEAHAAESNRRRSGGGLPHRQGRDLAGRRRCGVVLEPYSWTEPVAAPGPSSRSLQPESAAGRESALAPSDLRP